MTLLSFESRRAAEIAKLIANAGGTTVSAPSMREVPLSASAEATRLLRDLEASAIDVVILLTGVGSRALFDVLEAECGRQRVCDLLSATTVIVRGPKPRAALRELGLEPDHAVPEPNTWVELLGVVDGLGDIAGKRVAVQEYGRPNQELYDALQDRGAQVLAVPVYRWALPEDLAPLRQGVRRLAERRADVAIFTSAQQCNHILQIADELGLRDAVSNCADGVVIASVGPICTEELERHGIAVDIEPTKPKMGPLIKEIAERAPEIRRRKVARRVASPGARD